MVGPNSGVAGRGDFPVARGLAAGGVLAGIVNVDAVLIVPDDADAELQSRIQLDDLDVVWRIAPSWGAIAGDVGKFSVFRHGYSPFVSTPAGVEFVADMIVLGSEPRCTN